VALDPRGHEKLSLSRPSGEVVRVERSLRQVAPLSIALSSLLLRPGYF